MDKERDYRDHNRSKLRGWFGLLMGIAAVWFLAFVALPPLQRLPVIKPVMEAISASDINVTSYWYTQSEETAYAAMYVRKTIDSIERRH